MSQPQIVHPNREQLELHVQRANKLLPRQDIGFVKCSIVSDDPPVVAYDFIGKTEARQFLTGKEATTTGFRLDENNPMRVLQTVQIDSGGF
jgi:hypothetical protein